MHPESDGQCRVAALARGRAGAATEMTQRVNKGRLSVARHSDLQLAAAARHPLRPGRFLGPSLETGLLFDPNRADFRSRHSVVLKSCCRPSRNGPEPHFRAPARATCNPLEAHHPVICHVSRSCTRIDIVQRVGIGIVGNCVLGSLGLQLLELKPNWSSSLRPHAKEALNWSCLSLAINSFRCATIASAPIAQWPVCSLACACLGAPLTIAPLRPWAGGRDPRQPAAWADRFRMLGSDGDGCRCLDRRRGSSIVP